MSNWSARKEWVASNGLTPFIPRISRGVDRTGDKHRLLAVVVSCMVCIFSLHGYSEEINLDSRQVLTQGLVLANLPPSLKNLDPAYADIFEVNALTSPLETEISSAPGHYPIEEKMLLGVISTITGWSIQLKVSTLSGPDSEEISAENVFLQLEGGDQLPLDTLQMLVEEGLPGEMTIAASLAIVAENLIQPGLYSGEITVIASRPDGLNTRTLQVPFQVRVECRISHNIANNKIYMHFADLPAQQSGMISGAVSSDAPVWLQISTEEGRLTELPLQHSMGTTEHLTNPCVPMVWKLFDNPGGELRPPDRSNSDNSENAWLLQGAPGEVTYGLEMSLHPSGHQAPGDYGMVVNITLLPVL